MLRARVVCVGNDLCHDDGVAIRIAHQLCESGELGPDVEVIRVAELGLSALDAFLNVEHVIVVDAVVTGNEPGNCSYLSHLDFAPSATCSIGHAVSLDAMLTLVKELSADAEAPRISIVGIEAAHLAPFGTALTPAVQAAIPHAVALVKAAIGA
jgi:hydrogenase maturation protease